MYSLLVRLWRTFGGALQWRVLWLFHAKFIVGVSAIVLNDSGDVLLLRHRFWKPGSWGLPSGYAIRGEQLEETVRRELKEETNLDVEVARLLAIKTGFRLRLEATFLGHLTGGIMRLDKNEVLEAKFFPPHELPVGLLVSHKDLVATHIL